jgi:dihydrofolate synthase/folylpolyglutamate synthase
MTRKEAIAFIHGADWKNNSLGVRRMRDLLHRLGDPQNSMHFIHVAGTNGKGSVCSMLSAIMMQFVQYITYYAPIAFFGFFCNTSCNLWS